MDNSQVADQALHRYLSAQASNESDELGELLASRAEPIIRKVVFWRISESRADAEDVCADTILNLVQRLQRYKEENDRHPIEDFAAYAATTAHHACDQYLRRKNPAVWRLRNRVRYVLEHNPKFAVWRNSQGVWVCGLVIWKSQEQTGETPSPKDFATSTITSLQEFVSRLFRCSSAPLALSAVVELARVVMEVPSRFLDPVDVLEFTDSKVAADLQFEQRSYAEELWKEIQSLPHRQRRALLLNLKNDAMNLLLLTGVASFKQIAAVLETEMEALAALWKRLPLEDVEIAQMLECTRQQVINFRMAARKRLANRLGGWR